jgi:hypothetical protein
MSETGCARFTLVCSTEPSTSRLRLPLCQCQSVEQVWISRAQFESSIHEFKRARQIFSEADAHFKRQDNAKEEVGASAVSPVSGCQRVMLLEGWVDFEKRFGDSESLNQVGFVRIMPDFSLPPGQRQGPEAHQEKEAHQRRRRGSSVSLLSSESELFAGRRRLGGVLRLHIPRSRRQQHRAGYSREGSPMEAAEAVTTASYQRLKAVSTMWLVLSQFYSLS